MALKAGRVGVHPSQVDLFGKIVGGGSGDSYTKAEADAKFETQTHAAGTYESKASAEATYETKTNAEATYETKSHAATTYESKSDAQTAYNNLSGAMDEWSTSSTVQSDDTVTFTGLNDNYGYDLYCVDKLIGISEITKTTVGTTITLAYKVTGATAGDTCKLRILK